ncbi:hypothetical protein [Flammeovirga sp. SJP92]|uniref:hypothetical protein n=1 Tax=Flammeovirga sp. SJP92 TaxID=1775430 RepID=UPI0012F7F673|nr:hypothetical protein [Flammeovirga sp. SJP92]
MMINKLFLFSIIYLLFGNSYPIEIKHPISVNHPGISVDDKVEALLVEVQNDQHVPLHYYINVLSVACGDQHCKIDTITIQWDCFGRFEQLILPQGVTLEKNEGVLFSDHDYQKLDRILKMKPSPLEDLLPSEIVKDSGGDGVDGTSGATVSIHKNAYVEGAVWTCYTLWHWVNGEAVDYIKNTTGERLTIDQLLAYLKEEHSVFALEQLVRKKEYDALTVNTMMEVMIESPELIDEVIEYFEKGPASIYTYAMLQLHQQLPVFQRVICLQSLLQKNVILTEEQQLILALKLDDFVYQEVDLYLKLLEQQKQVSSTTKNHLFKLLRNDHFIIARRVYWYLNERPLTEKERAIINDFEGKYSEDL